MNKLALFLIATSSLLACGGGSKPTAAAATENPCGDNPCAATENPCGDNPCAVANPCGENPCAGASDSTDWSSWQTWTKVNSKTFASKGHKKPWVDVYVTDLAAYKAGGDMAEGFAAVKAIHKEQDGKAGEVTMLTVMRKMGSDYDPDNGNWYYAVMAADGSKAMQEGKLEMCSSCHASGDDYLFASKVPTN